MFKKESDHAKYRTRVLEKLPKYHRNSQILKLKMNVKKIHE